MKYTREALYKGLSVIKEGTKLNDVCTAIESVAKEHLKIVLNTQL